MKKPTSTEIVTGSLFTQGALTAISAVTGTPLAALLPLLSNTLAANRYKKRVDETIDQINKILQQHQARLDFLTDAQYKFINEVVVAVLQNTEIEKFEYLRRAVINGLEESELSHTLAVQVTRALRDMTAGELDYIIKYSEFIIVIGPIVGEIFDPEFRVIDRKADEMIYISGLMGLGALIPEGSSQDDTGRFVFAKFCKTLKRVIER